MEEKLLWYDDDSDRFIHRHILLSKWTEGGCSTAFYDDEQQVLTQQAVPENFVAPGKTLKCGLGIESSPLISYQNYLNPKVCPV